MKRQMRKLLVALAAVVAFAAITAPVAAPQANPSPNPNAGCVPKLHVEGTPGAFRSEARGPFDFPIGLLVSHFAVVHEGGSEEECFTEQNGGH